MKKFILSIVFLFCLFQIPVYAQNNYKFDFIFENKIQLDNKNIEVSGKSPYIDKFKNNDFAKTINQEITSIYKKKLEMVISQKTKSLKIDYQVKAGKNIVSLLLYFTGAKKEIETINFNLQSCEFISISDILGPNAIDLVNKIIKDDTIKSSKKYNLNFTGIDNEHNFYIDDDNLVITFDEYELSPAVKNIQKFNIKISSVINKSIDENDYYITKPYNLKMIPLREICDAFGYKSIWNVTSYSVQIIGKNLTANVFVNRNNYIKNNQSPQTLESVPQIKNGKVYVPISFFTEYLNLLYSVDENGTITFTNY